MERPGSVQGGSGKESEVSPKTPVPADASELEEMLNERDTRLGDVMHAYIAEQTELVRAQLTEGMQITLADMVKGVPAGGTGTVTAPGLSADSNVTPAMLADAERARFANAGLPMRNAIAHSKLFNKNAIGAQVNDLDYSKSMGDFLQAIWHRAEGDYPERADTVRAFKRSLQNALAERVPSQGGFLVPEILRSQILMVALEQAVVRPRARVIPMDSLRVPYPTIDDTTHTSTVYGGVFGSWTEESATIPVSQPAFGRIVLEAKKLTASTTIPNELLHDAVAALDQWFNEMFPIAIAWFEDVAFIAGSGSGQPQGFLNSPCAITGPARAGGAGAAIQYTDLASLYARLLPNSLNSAVWLCSPDVLPSLLNLVTASGIAPPLWLPNMSASGGYPGGGDGSGYRYNILGRPLIVSEKMPALNAAGCLALVDFGYYLLGDRQAMTISSSEHYLFANDLTIFRIVERLDGRTWIQSAITPENGGNTLSPVVLVHA
jgi:HK97 family phage major capsid protein